MATGDKIWSAKVVGHVQTTDATTTVVAEITVPSGTEGMLRIRGRLDGYESGQNAPRFNTFHGVGTVDAGTVAYNGGTAMEPSNSYDLANLTWSGGMQASAGKIQLTATGGAADTVDWFGELEVDLIEVPITGA